MVWVFDTQCGEHFWTVIGSLQSVVLVMNICHTPHLLDLVTISVLSCGHMCATECLFAWVVMVGYLVPVFCQVYTRLIRHERERLLEVIFQSFWEVGNDILKRQQPEMESERTSTLHKA